MRNIKLTLEYDGRKYCGWQRQSAKRLGSRNKSRPVSIQEIIEACLSRILKQKICVAASGRTDSGVHALGQVASFKTSAKIDPRRLKLALNCNLPK